MQPEIQHILDLLLSDDERNHALGLQLMQSQGLQAAVLEAIFPPADCIKVEGGSFIMGDDHAADSTPAHTVRLDSFYMHATPVTQLQYRLILQRDPSEFKDDQRPVERVSWFDAVLFCNTLSEWMGLQPAYSIDMYTDDPHNNNSAEEMKWTVLWDRKANGYRLPTEAEWEFAARGGIHSQGYIYAGGNALGKVAWHLDNAKEQTHPVKGKKPNELGLYDLSGNVTEWCWDWFSYDENYYEISPTHNPTGSERGRLRLTRGGSWRSSHAYSDLRVSDRSLQYPHSFLSDTGFRVVRNG